MGEVVNAIVAVAVIIIIVRWATSGRVSLLFVGPSSNDDRRSAAGTLGFRPKHVTQEMINQVHMMFPDIPPDNIRFDLLRTGNVELTTNKILERGFLEAPPPAYYTIYPRTQGPTPHPSTASRTTSTAPETTVKQLSLIERYNLQGRVSDTPSIPETIEAGGRANWEDTPEKREASLRERKAQMILAARQRMLVQQQKESASG
ncbi:hypothetical protein ID866_7312 [Astraeus odoratus]|nr:hypothetical protein ID866_7312 [Astraeus odoratus]